MFCINCFKTRQKEGFARKKRIAKGGGDQRLLSAMRKVLYEDTKESEEMLRKLKVDNPAKYLDLMSKLEPKSDKNEGGPVVTVITLPAKVSPGLPCDPPAAETRDAVERLVMELEDKKGG